MDLYQDPTEALDDRVDDLLARMTLAEKIKQLGGVWSTELAAAGSEDGLDEAAAAALLTGGIGHVTRIAASTGLTPERNARFTNRIQAFLVEQTRLGVPAVVHEEAVAGFCARGATQFPQAIGLASTFDTAAVRAMAEVVRAQMVAVGARQALAPVLDIARDPRWGRVEETYGEDPYLASRLGVAFVRGLQGDDLRQGVLATAKHFLGYGLPEGGMNHAPVHLGGRELREVFAEPFAAAIRDAGLGGIMNSYSSVDGLPCGASAQILDELLRGELGFEGLVVADYFTLNLLIAHHRVAAEKADAARMALVAGMDVELPTLDCFATLAEQVESRTLDEKLIDRSVRRVLRSKFQLGLFESPYADIERVQLVFDTAPQRRLAYELAASSLVMLKNDGVLPLTQDQSIAVLGPLADDMRLLQGDYSYPAHTEIVYRRDELGQAISPARGTAFDAGPHFVAMSTPLQAFEQRQVKVVRALGARIDADDESEIPAAVRAAEEADVAVIFVGGKSGLLPDCTSGEFRDASHLELTGAQQQLIERVAASGTAVVTVVIGGRVFALENVVDVSNALVEAWLPGEEGARAIVDMLYGDVNPSGRLPISLPRHVGQVPIHYNHRSGGGASQPLGDYSDGPTRPLYAFGHGLSYSEYHYGALDCPEHVDVYDFITVALDVANTSEIAGAEVIQLYVRDLVASVARPVQQLVGFRRVEFAPGEQHRIVFEVDVTQLAFYGPDMELVVEPGTVELRVGAASDDIRQRAEVEITGDRRVVNKRQVVATQVRVE